METFSGTSKPSPWNVFNPISRRHNNLYGSGPHTTHDSGRWSNNGPSSHYFGISPDRSSGNKGFEGDFFERIYSPDAKFEAERMMMASLSKAGSRDQANRSDKIRKYCRMTVVEIGSQYGAKEWKRILSQNETTDIGVILQLQKKREKECGCEVEENLATTDPSSTLASPSMFDFSVKSDQYWEEGLKDYGPGSDMFKIAENLKLGSNPMAGNNNSRHSLNTSPSSKNETTRKGWNSAYAGLMPVPTTSSAPTESTVYLNFLNNLIKKMEVGKVVSVGGKKQLIERAVEKMVYSRSAIKAISDTKTKFGWEKEFTAKFGNNDFVMKELYQKNFVYEVEPNRPRMSSKVRAILEKHRPLLLARAETVKSDTDVVDKKRTEKVERDREVEPKPKRVGKKGMKATSSIEGTLTTMDGSGVAKVIKPSGESRTAKEIV
uniref:Uncharacterized protein n=1 Tax=Rhabditophanes sp. KR3021 TaxID=114890 RepID=A0AC35THW6_9BILA